MARLASYHMNQQPEVDKLAKGIRKFLQLKNNTIPEVTRLILEPFLDDIKRVNSIDFIQKNLEEYSRVYSVQLLLCLYDLWRDLDEKKLITLINLVDQEKEPLLQGLMEFVYKYLGINIFDLLLKSDLSYINKKDILDYYYTYPRFLFKSNTEYSFLNVEEKNYKGVTSNDLSQIKDSIFRRGGVEPALDADMLLVFLEEHREILRKKIFKSSEIFAYVSRQFTSKKQYIHLYIFNSYLALRRYLKF